MTRPDTTDALNARLEPGTRVALVVSRYHADLTGWMADSARAELRAAGLAPEDVLVVEAPGAFELPFLARALARREDVRSVLCFGLVLKGETEHDRHIARAVASGLVSAAFETDTPIHFGVLTCSTRDQAEARAKPASLGGRLDKGREVARAAIDTLVALSAIRTQPTAP